MSLWNLTFEGTRSEVWLMHTGVSGERLFVARFKYASPKRKAKHFAKFLTKHFSPEEYAAIREAKNGTTEGTPLMILKAKGYEPLMPKVRINRDAIYRSLGLVKVKGAAGGTYWE